MGAANMTRVGQNEKNHKIRCSKNFRYGAEISYRLVQNQFYSPTKGTQKKTKNAFSQKPPGVFLKPLPECTTH